LKFQKINLSIAGFLIQVTFKAYKDTDQKRIIKGILKYHHGFIIDDSLNKPDFYILLSKEYKKRRQKRNRIECNIKYFPQFVFLISGIVQQLLNKTGFLLHASSAVKDDKAILFFGPSGVGKSTVIRLLSGTMEPFSDDGVYIKKEKGQFYVYQTPFREENNLIEKTGQRFQLGAICFLKKDHIFEIKKIQNKQYWLIKLIEQTFSDKQYIVSQIQCVFNMVKNFDRIYLFKFAENKNGILKLFSKKDIFY